MENDKSHILYRELDTSRSLSLLKIIWILIASIVVIIFFSYIALFIIYPLVHQIPNRYESSCADMCMLSIVESIPQNISFPSTFNLNQNHPNTFEAWSNLIANTKHNISIASSYWTLRSNDVYYDNSSWQGQAIFDALYHAGAVRGIKIRIVHDADLASPDTMILSQSANAEVRKVNFPDYFGHGILHTKLWIFDNLHFYIGSANMDWRSLTQVKEIGLVIKNCSCLATDIMKIFETYWYLGDPSGSKIPSRWPSYFSTNINSSDPMIVKGYQELKSRDLLIDRLPTLYQTYITSSPAELCADGRTNDIDGVVKVISTAKKFIYISVMEYIPGTLYLKKFQYWSVIDDALKTAALNRGVKIKLLISWWKHSNPNIFPFLRSLIAISGAEHADIQVKIMIIPAFDENQKNIPYARVNHAKYMVTEDSVYIGTSNWSADYFRWTGGVGLVLTPNRTQISFNNVSKSGETFDIRKQAENIFLRDWNSLYAIDLNNFTIPHDY